MVARYDWKIEKLASGAWRHEIWDTHTGEMVWTGSPHILQGGAIMCVAMKCLELNDAAAKGVRTGGKGRKGSKKATGAGAVPHAGLASCCPRAAKAKVEV